jgi:hypothetical protein
MTYIHENSLNPYNAGDLKSRSYIKSRQIFCKMTSQQLILVCGGETKTEDITLSIFFPFLL